MRQLCGLLLLAFFRLPRDPEVALAGHIEVTELQQKTRYLGEAARSDWRQEPNAMPGNASLEPANPLVAAFIGSRLDHSQKGLQ